MTPAELHAYAQEVARELGWRYDLRESTEPEGHLLSSATVKPGLTEYGVRLRVDWRRKSHVEASGIIPSKDRDGAYCWSYSGPVPRIRVRLDRGASAVARSILGRLLPQYQPAYEAAKRRLAVENAQLEERDRAIAILGDFGRIFETRRERSAIYLHSGGKVTITTVGVDLNLPCTIEQAEQILIFLRDDTSG